MYRIPIIILVAGLAGCTLGKNGALDVTGQIEGKVVHAGSKVGGRIAEVVVEEGASVATGDMLARLDDTEAKAVLAAARANLAKAEALIAKLEAGATEEQIRQAEAGVEAARQQHLLAVEGPRKEEILAAEAAVSAARAQYQTAKAERERLTPLVEREAVSKMELDRVSGATDAALAQMEVAQQRASALKSGARAEEIAAAKAALDRAVAFLDEVKRGARSEDLDAARAARDAAAADVQRAESALAEMTIVAPVDGLVESIDVRVGDLVRPGPVVQLVNPEDLELSVYVSAKMLGYLGIGQSLPLTTDAHGDERFEGTIAYIASQGEFTPRNLQTEEERVQQVFEVRMNLNSSGGKLRAGMAATVHLPKPGEA